MAKPKQGSETELLQKCKKWLQEADIFHVRLEGSGKLYRNTWIKSQSAGLPDLMICYQGVVYFAELKTKRGSLSDNQIHMLKKLLSQNIKAAVVRSLDGLIAFVQDKPPTKINKHNIPEYV